MSKTSIYFEDLEIIKIKDDKIKLNKFKNKSIMARKQSKNKREIRLNPLSQTSLINPEKQSGLKLNLAHLETKLPKLKYKSIQNKGSLVEVWLNENLQTNIKNQAELEEGNSMKNLRDFQMDRLFLKSQDISSNMIDKLYNSLYIYTSGITTTFDQILKLSKNNQNIGENIVINFWNLYSKLLQGCTSYKNTYQIVEKKHIKDINNYTQKIKNKQEELLNQKYHCKEKISNLKKQISGLELNLSNLKGDYRVMKETLDFTDEAFNQQVLLRLKFQEKVNSVYTSYGQVKTKYQQLSDKYRINSEQTLKQQSTQSKLQQKIEKLTIEKVSLKQKLYMQEIKRQQMYKQLQIAKQQLRQRQNHALQTQYKQKSGEDIITEQLNKNTSLKAKLNETNINLKTYSNIIKQQNIKIEQLNNTVERLRQQNSEIYHYLQKNREELVRNETEKKTKDKIIKEIKQQSEKNKVVKEQMEGYIIEYRTQIQQLKEQLQQSVNQGISKSSMVERNNETIQNLKAVRKKQEKLYEIILGQKLQFEVEMNRYKVQSENQHEEIVGFQLLLESKNKIIKELQDKMYAEKSLMKKKITVLTDNVKRKDLQISDINGKLATFRTDMQYKIMSIQELNNEHTRKDAQIKKKQNQYRYIQENFIKMEAMIEQKQKQIQLKNQKILILSKLNDKFHQQLLSKQSLDKDEEYKTNLSVQGLKKIIQQYRQITYQKVQFIHPMINESLREQLIRLLQKIQRIQIQRSILKEKQKKLMDNLQQNEIVIINLKTDMANQCKELKQRNQTKKNQTIKVKEDQKLNKQKQLTLSHLVNQLKQQKIYLLEKINQFKMQLINIKQQCQRYIDENDILKHKSEENNIKINRLKDRLKKTKQMMNQMTQKANQLKKVKQVNEMIKNIHKDDKEVQIQFKIEFPQQKEIIQVYDREVQTNLINFQNYQVGQKINQLKPMQSQSKSNKKVQVVDFKRALRLTYMRH